MRSLLLRGSGVLARSRSPYSNDEKNKVHGLRLAKMVSPGRLFEQPIQTKFGNRHEHLPEGELLQYFGLLDAESTAANALD